MDTENFNEDIAYDLGNLTIYNSSHTDFSSDPVQLEKQVQRLALENFRRIFSKLVEIRAQEEASRDLKKLDLQIHDFDKTEYHVKLPEPKTLFPRMNPMPSRKDLTKWERFAQDKGIRKEKKRPTKVFDEPSQEWVFRHGGKGIQQLNKKRDIIREVSGP